MRRATVLGLTFVLAVHAVAAQDTTRFGDDASEPVRPEPCGRLMTTTVGGRTLERVVFDEIVVNPELSKADFRVERK
jgi:hypothetical protein